MTDRNRARSNVNAGDDWVKAMPQYPVMASQRRITEITWEGLHSTLVLRRSAPGVVVLTIKGTDVGEHGSGPFDELAEDILNSRLVLFIDARNSRGVATDVSSDWSKWLSRNRRALLAVHMLTGSAYVQVTANFVRNFAELSELMRIYTEPAEFDAALSAALAAASAVSIVR
jgi:hypothetical protein